MVAFFILVRKRFINKTEDSWFKAPVKIGLYGEHGVVE
jgi:hypothetical protein